MAKPDFNVWMIRTHKRPWVGILACAGPIAGFYAKFYAPSPPTSQSASGTEMDNWWQFGIFAFQLLVIIGLSCWHEFGKAANKTVPGWLARRKEQDIGNAEAALTQFGHWWGSLWWWWFVLYLMLTALSFPPAASHLKPYDDYFPVLFNLVGSIPTVCLMMCYVVLRWPEARPKAWKPFAAFLILLIVAQATCIKMNWQSGALTVNWLNSMVSVVTIALVVGRLESLFLAPPLWTVVALYLYAAIQAGQVLFFNEQAKPMAIGFFVLALLLKYIFFCFIYFARTEGPLLEYLLQLQIFSRESREELEAYSAADELPEHPMD